MHPPPAPAAHKGRGRRCAVPGTLVLLLAYLAYLALGTGVFWALEGRAAQDSSRNFQREKWELLQNYTCLDGPALDLLIRVRGERGGSGRGGEGQGSEGSTGPGREGPLWPGTENPGSAHPDERWSGWTGHRRGALGVGSQRLGCAAAEKIGLWLGDRQRLLRVLL